VVDPDVVARRLLALSESLKELERPEAGDATALAASSMLRAAVERWLQVAIEACIDVASHVIASEGWPPPSTGREAFMILAQHGRIPGDLAQRLGLAVGLRNILVHDYARTELTILARTIRGDLPDLRDFAKLAAGWIEGS
jgi:uncharacterized protein YutE (UPF0331/DUF86 family)